jgi:signal transduction histidine kinase
MLGDRWRPGVRARVTVGAVLVLGAVLAVGCVGVVAIAQQALTANLDLAASLRARDVQSLLSAGSVTTVVPGAGEESSFVQVVGADGRVLAGSPNVAGQGPVLPPPGGARQITTTLDSSPLENGPLRVVAVPVHLPSGAGWIYVGTSLVQLRTTIGTLTLLFATGLPALLLVVAWTVWRTVGRALRPIEAIRVQAARIGDGDLAQRVPVPDSSDEVGRLASTMNEMLDRLEASASRQQRFIGDASHELRSPLTAMRARVGVALAHPDPQRAEELLTTIDQQTRRMSALIDSLLFLARSNEALPDTGHTDVDLDELVLEEARRLRSMGELRIEVPTLSAARVRGSSADLGRMLRNLGDNAHDHAATTITLSLTTTAESAEITVADDGPGIPPPDRERIFDRFTRLDDSRARNSSGGGSGLGLAIARQIARSHAGTITVDDPGELNPGTVFTVRLPLTEIRRPAVAPPRQHPRAPEPRPRGGGPVRTGPRPRGQQPPRR